MRNWPAHHRLTVYKAVIHRWNRFAWSLYNLTWCYISLGKSLAQGRLPSPQRRTASGIPVVFESRHSAKSWADLVYCLLAVLFVMMLLHGIVESTFFHRRHQYLA